jgi:hypothetical protein
MSIELDFERTIDDVIDFNLFHMAQSSSIQQQLIGAQLFVGVVTASFVFGATYFALRRIEVLVVIICIAAGILAYAIYPGVYHKLFIGRLKKLLAEGDNKTMLGRQVISFSPEGLDIKSKAFESKINWSAIDKVAQNEKYVYLYTSSVNALIIPKNSLRSEKQQQDFWDYINKYCQGLIYA